MGPGKSLYERLAERFVGDGADADRRMYVTVLDPSQAHEYADDEIVADAVSGGISGVLGPKDVVYFEDGGDLHVYVKSTDTVWVPSARALGSWENVTDQFDDVTLKRLRQGSANPF